MREKSKVVLENKFKQNHKRLNVKQMKVKYTVNHLNKCDEQYRG